MSLNRLPNFDIAAKGDRVWEDPCEGWRNDRFLERKRRRVGDHGASLGTGLQVAAKHDRLERSLRLRMEASKRFVRGGEIVYAVSPTHDSFIVRFAGNSSFEMLFTYRQHG